MTVTEVLSYGAVPPPFTYGFLRKIRYHVPKDAFFGEGDCVVGCYIVPFVNRLGQVVAWIPFASQDNQETVFVRIPYPADPTRVYRVNNDGTLDVVCKTVNEDW
jgi:hypothetical protein